MKKCGAFDHLRWSWNLRIYMTLILLSIGVVWFIPYFPTQDGPSHVYNLVILHDLVNGGKEWGRYFYFDPRLTPNLGFHVVAYPILLLFGPLLVEKIFVSIYVILMATAVPYFLRAFARDAFPVSFLAVPFLFNYALMMGFYSFSLAVPCMLTAIALSWRIRNRSILTRLIVFNLLGFCIFYMHLIPFAIYLLALLLMIPASGSRRTWLKDTMVLALLVTPCVFNFVMYMLPAVNRPAPQSTVEYSFSRFYELLVKLPTLSLDTFTRWQLLPWFFLFILLYLCMRASISEYMNNRRGFSSENIFISSLTISMVLIYLSFPFEFGGGCFFNERLPWVIGLLMLPLLSIPTRGLISRHPTAVFAGIALIFIVSQAVVLREQSTMVTEFLGGLGMVRKTGAIIATVKEFRPEWSRIDPLLNTASYYGIADKCVNAGNYEAYTDLVPVRFRNPLPNIPPLYQTNFQSNTISWSRYPAVEYLLAWDINASLATKLSKNFDRILVNKRFTLWHKKPEPDM